MRNPRIVIPPEFIKILEVLWVVTRLAIYVVVYLVWIVCAAWVGLVFLRYLTVGI